MSQLHPTISLLHPTARVKPSEQFPRGWKDAFDVWLARADHPENIEYVLSVHKSRWEDFQQSEEADSVRMREDATRKSENGHWWAQLLAVENVGRDCVVDQLNCAAENSSGKLLCGVQDDVVPPEHWDTLILEALNPPNITNFYLPALSEEYLLHFASGSPRDKELIVAGAMTRKRYERYGYCLDPDFEGMFSDDWLSFQAHRDEAAGLVKIITRLDIEFTHNRPGLPNRHGNPRAKDFDEVYQLQNRKEAYQQGRATFMSKAYGTRALFVCLPGESFYWKVEAARFAMLAHMNAGLRFLLTPIWGYSTNVHDIRVTMAEQVLKHDIRADLVLSVDDDNIVTAEQFDMLVGDLDADPDLDIVVGFCWCDNDGEDDPETGEPKPWMISVGRQGPDFECLKLTHADLMQAVESGTMLITSDDMKPDAFWSGFPVVLMRGSVLEKLGARAFLPILRDDVRNGIVSEDASFFYRAQQAGLKCAVDLRVMVPHLKTRGIEPQFIPLSEKAAALKARGKFEFPPSLVSSAAG